MGSARAGALTQFLLLAAVLLAFPEITTRAAEWKVDTSLSIGETYTDNVGLTVNASKQDDWVTEISPKIGFTARGARARVSASYAPLLIYHARNKNDDRADHRLNATVWSELVEKAVFVDAAATVNQYNAS